MLRRFDDINELMQQYLHGEPWIDKYDDKILEITEELVELRSQISLNRKDKLNKHEPKRYEFKNSYLEKLTAEIKSKEKEISEVIRKKMESPEYKEFLEEIKKRKPYKDLDKETVSK